MAVSHPSTSYLNPPLLNDVVDVYAEAELACFLNPSYKTADLFLVSAPLTERDF